MSCWRLLSRFRFLEPSVLRVKSHPNCKLALWRDTHAFLPLGDHFVQYNASTDPLSFIYTEPNSSQSMRWEGCQKRAYVSSPWAALLGGRNGGEGELPSWPLSLFFSPALLRYNWHITLHTFRVYNLMIHIYIANCSPR